MAKPIKVKEFGRFTIYDSGDLGDAHRFYAEGTDPDARGQTLPDTGSSLEELEEKLKKYDA
jgi:hypothetical protein